MSKEMVAKKYLDNNTVEWLIIFFCLLTFTGFVSSRAVASIGMIGLIALAVVTLPAISLFRNYYKQPVYLVLSLFFWIVFISGLYSHNHNDWINWVRIKLPYLGLPLAFASFKQLQQRKFILLLYGFCFIMLISVMLVLGNYIMHYQSINQSVIMGHSIPMPFSHIRYTLMLCFSFFCLIYMHRQGWFIYSENEKHLQVFFAVILFVSIHILSVRSGLVALYAGLLCLLFYIVLFEKKYVAATLLLLVFTLVPFITYRFVPSFQNKMNYMRYDLSGLATGEINNRYDVMRLASMKTGLLVWKQNKIIGTGAGDLGSAMNSIYETTLPQLLVTNRLLPHNQLVWVLASLGVVGFSAFMFAFMFPLLINRYYRNWLFVVFHVTIFSSFFTEATLEEQIGTGFYLLFLLVLLNQLKNE